ncbi:Protein transport protein Sec31A [Hordeum vulgare]|nr:Protein transport protein Sec31A [Hordeum vulgare]
MPSFSDADVCFAFPRKVKLNLLYMHVRSECSDCQLKPTVQLEPRTAVVRRQSSLAAEFVRSCVMFHDFTTCMVFMVMKREWDVAGGGAPHVVGTEDVVDFIPMNRWLKRVNLPRRVAFVRLPCSRGRAPRTGHEDGSRDPLHFYAQITDDEVLAILIIPPKFVEVMNEWLMVKLPHAARLSANKWCEFWVQVAVIKDIQVDEEPQNA